MLAPEDVAVLRELATMSGLVMPPCPCTSAPCRCRFRLFAQPIPGLRVDVRAVKTWVGARLAQGIA